MTVFITGGTSSIGRVLVRELAKEQLGWQPQSFLDGLSDTWKEYKELGWSISD
jgi:nucleoside-diphosphate-sugar epimerase